MALQPVSTERLVKSLRLNAKDLDKSYGDRDDEFEEAAAAWAMREAAKRLIKLEAKVKRLEARIQSVKKK